MAYTTKKRPDDTLAPKLTLKSLKHIIRLLTLVGKPLYLIFTYALVAILFILYITGHSARIFFSALLELAYGPLVKLFAKLFPLKIQISKPKLPQITIPKLKVPKARFIGQLVLTIFKKIFILFINIALVSLQILAKLVVISWKVGRATTSYLKKKYETLEPKVKLRVLALKLRLTLANIFAPFRRIEFPRLKILALLASVTLASFLIASGIFLWTVIFYDLPSPEALATRNIEVSTKIYDRNGVLLYKIFKNKNRTPVSLDEIPVQVRLATIAIEDAEFYKHPGISFRGIARATLRNIKQGELAGGSTITQQLVKNALLTPEKTLTRKLREVVLAIKVELAYDKDEILEMYLNEVSYGGTAYGIQEASRAYFDKNVERLTLGEAALLAGLPKSPTRFSPFGTRPELAFARQREVLRLMRLNGFITEKQRMEAEREQINFARNITDIKAPHFVMYVRDALVEKYGEEVVEAGGLEVITTLDYRVQKMAEEIVKEEVEKLARLNVGNGASLVLDTQSGEILAMVGSKDYFNMENDGNVNVTIRPRQPGSSIKVVNYSYALTNGYTTATILEDTPVTFNVQGLPPYTPTNYDGNFRGKLTLRNALAESRNVPAVKVLASYGVGNMVTQGTKMGITTWSDPYDYGLSLTLGGGEVKLIDLASVYSTVANYGKKTNTTSVLKVTNYEGKVLTENSCQKEEESQLIVEVAATESAFKQEQPSSPNCEPEQVLDPRVAYLLIDILRDNNARSPAFGSNSLLVIPERSDIAVKTGTSNDLRDNLTIGFNQNYLVAVWVGNNDNSPMSRVASGITGATPIWYKTMSALLASEENHEWDVPSGLVQVPICTITGTLTCNGCPTRNEWFLAENKPTYSCNPEFIMKLKDNNEKVEIDSSDEL